MLAHKINRMKRSVTLDTSDAGESSYSSSKRARIGSKALIPTKKAVDREISRMLRVRGLNPELKFFYTTATATAFAGSGIVDCLVSIAQGSDETNRIGDRIKVKRIEIRGYVQSGNQPFDQASCALVIDRQMNGTVPPMNVSTTATTAAPFVYVSTGAPSGGAILKNDNWAKRFKILKQDQFAANQQIAATGYVEKGFVYTANFKYPLDVEFSNTTGASTSVATNAILFCYSNVGGSTSVMNYVAKVSYFDA